MRTRDWLCFLLLWGLCIFIVNPVGEFPLNDDWGYAQVVKRLLDTGQYEPGTWPVMTLFTQVYWGAAFAAIFGFSFTILRLSTLALAILGSYWIFRENLRLSSDRYWSWIAMCCLLLNPLYFQLSFTFMTDVPFTVGIIGAILLFRRAFEEDNGWYWAAACAATVTATLIRQPALLLAPAFGLAVVLRRPSWKSAGWALAAIVLSYGALLWYVYFIGLQGETPGAPESLGPLIRRLRFPLILELLVKRGGAILFYVSVFVLPLLLLRISSSKLKPRSRKQWIGIGVAACITITFAYFSWSELPVGNIIEFFGSGPTPMVGRDNRYFDPANIPYVLWPLLRVGGYMAVFLCLYFLISRLPHVPHWREWPPRTFWKLGLFFFILAYSLYLLLDRIHFDRYYLAILPPAILFLTSTQAIANTRWKISVVCLFLLLTGLFSVGATRDNLNWNRTRWSVLRLMVEKEGIPPEKIDGGLEFNGWYGTGPQNPFSFEHKSWWFVNEDQYVLSFSKDIPCAVRSRAYPVDGWWPGRDTLYVHQRPALAGIDTIFTDVEQIAVADSSRLAANLPGFSFGGADLRVTDRTHSGRYAFYLTPEHAYAAHISLRPVQPCEAITVSAWRLGNNLSAGIVASAPDVADFHTFQNGYIELVQPDNWHRIRHEIRLPEDYPSDQLDIYLWNSVNDSIWMDDVRVIWRRVE